MPSSSSQGGGVWGSTVSQDLGQNAVLMQENSVQLNTFWSKI